MRTRRILTISLIAGILLMTSCYGSIDMGPTGTPDPFMMSIEERTIWDFENFRNDVNDLAAAAFDTPVEDLEPILHQMQMLNGEIFGYEYPLFAAQAHSALFYFANSTTQCYMFKYDVYLNELSDEGLAIFYGDFDHCERAQEFAEAFDLYLRELKELNAAE